MFRSFHSNIRLVSIRFFFSLFCFFNIYSTAFSQIIYNEQEAFARANELNRPVFLVFSGTDWCIPCMRFQKEILSDSSFLEYADSNFVILKAEFPQRKKLDPETVKQNDRLAEKYNPTGLFPHLVLVKPNGDFIREAWYDNQEPVEFISQLKKILPTANGLKEFRTSALLMGCGFEFTIVDSANSTRNWDLLDDCIREVRRIEGIISEWIDTSEVSQLNASAGKEPVRVSRELYNLIDRSMEISRLTQGSFDISFGGVGKLWDFKSENPVIPDSSQVRKALASVGYKDIKLLDSLKVFLSKPGMQIGFGGIGKGYAAEQVKKMLLKRGINSGVVNASGDMTAWGRRPDGSPWKVGISDPNAPEKVLLWLPVQNTTIATSGNYENYFEVDGVRYAHIIDPRTGYPTKGIKSVTVICPHAELSDALATAVFVMGIDAGLNFIEQLQGYYCIIVDDKNKIHYSKGVEVLFE